MRQGFNFSFCLPNYGTFVPAYFRSQERKYAGTKVLVTLPACPLTDRPKLYALLSCGSLRCLSGQPASTMSVALHSLTKTYVIQWIQASNKAEFKTMILVMILPVVQILFYTDLHLQVQTTVTTWQGWVFLRTIPVLLTPEAEPAPLGRPHLVSLKCNSTDPARHYNLHA